MWGEELKIFQSKMSSSLHERCFYPFHTHENKKTLGDIIPWALSFVPTLFDSAMEKYFSMGESIM